MTLWAALKISQKLKICFGAAVLALAGIAGFSIWSSIAGGSDFAEYRGQARQSVLLGDMTEDILSARLEVMKYRALDNSGAEAVVSAEIASFIEEKGILRDLSNDKALTSQIDQIAGDAQLYADRFADVVALDQTRHEIVRSILDVKGPEMRSQLSDVMETAYKDGDPAAAFYAAQVQQHLMLGRLYAQKFLLRGAPADKDRALTEIGVALTDAETLLSELQDPGRRALTREVQDGLTAYRDAFSKVATLYYQRQAILIEDLDVVGPRILSDADALLETAVAVQDTIGPQIARSFSNQPLILGVAALISMLAAAGAAVLLIRSIVGPISEITSILNRLKDGQTDMEIAAGGRSDEIGTMLEAAAALRQSVRAAFTRSQMIDQMPTPLMMADAGNDFKIDFMNPVMMDTMKQVGDELPVAVSELIGTSIDVFHKHPEHQRKVLSDPKNLPWSGRVTYGGRRYSLMVSAIMDNDGRYVGPMVAWDDVTERERLAETVGDAVKRVTASVGDAGTFTERLSMVSTQAQEKSTSVSAAAEEATQNVQSVASAAEQLATSISEITHQVANSSGMATEATSIAEETKTSASALSESSQKIGDIVKVISEIAEQTNLLALNATIEAARAGDAGKGFAVVANEVKALAEQTAKATVEIGQQITSMQSITDQSVRQIDTVTARISEIAETLATVAAAAEEQGSATQEISRSVQEAATGTQQVSHDITGVRDANAETDEAAVHLKDITHKLSGISSELGEAADQFLADMRAG